MKIVLSTLGAASQDGSPALRLATVTTSIVGVLALVLHYGFQLTRGAGIAVKVIEALVLASFVILSILHLIRATHRLQWIRSNWYELALVALVVLALVRSLFIDPDEAALLRLIAIQGAIFLFLVIRFTELLRVVARSNRFRPAQIFVTSFFMLIAFGSALLMLPTATGKTIHVRADAQPLLGRPVSDTEARVVEDDDAPAYRPIRGNVLRRDSQGLWVQTGSGNRCFADEDVMVIANTPRASWSTALFTATSSVCVTGLVVESTGGYWSLFGQGVILVLIQLGGLGIMTFGTVFTLILWQSLGFRESAVMRDVLSPTMSVQVGRVVVFILVSTALFEAIGATVIWNLWSEPGMSGLQRLYMSAFHSVSAFCNAGFCLYDDSLIYYRNTWQVNLGFTGLIITGGLGFIVIYNLLRIFRCHVRHLVTRLRGYVPQPELDRRRLTLQTKLVLLTTAILLVAGVGLVFLFETLPNYRHGGSGDGSFMGQATLFYRGLYSWFLSVTARTAGFNTVPTNLLTDSTKFLTIVLMFIGASPGSTGGGIKTATLAVIMCGIFSLLSNREKPQAFQRSIPQNILLRALVVLTLGAAIISIATVMLSAAHTKLSFLDALFEATSAFGTVGLSTGVTPQLNILGRLIIIAVMFIGRVGPLTLFIALPLGVRDIKYEYPHETVAIG